MQLRLSHTRLRTRHRCAVPDGQGMLAVSSWRQQSTHAAPTRSGAL